MTSNNLKNRHERYKEFLREKTKGNYAYYFGVALGASILLCSFLMLVSYLCAKLFFEGKTNELGDSFGSVNAVISTLAFLAVFIALIMQQKQIELQRKDLGLQRRELKNNTKELSLQRQEFEEQNRNIRLQRFENTFFQMLSLHHEIVAGLKLNTKIKKIGSQVLEPMTAERREVFSVLYEKAELTVEVYKQAQFEYFTGIKGLMTVYADIEDYDKVKELSIFDHYFRNLYRIFKFIDSMPERNLSIENDKEGVLTLNDKKHYAAIVRASLSEYELVMLFFNCLHMKKNVKEPQFKGFVEKYHLFNNIRAEKIGNDIFKSFMQHKESKYTDSAFNW